MRTDNKNFILGAGNELVETVSAPRRKFDGKTPYTVEQARDRLVPRLNDTVRSLREVPKLAMPRGEAVAKLTLHPQYLSKSAFPNELIQDAGLRAIGSRPDRIKPEKDSRTTVEKEEATSTVFVAGTVSAFESFAAKLQGPLSAFKEGVKSELTAVETLTAMVPQDRFQPGSMSDGIRVLECVLHAGRSESDREIIRAFGEYAREIGLAVDESQSIFASNLCFLSVKGDIQAADKLAWFSFLRRIRPMPRIRLLLPARFVRESTGTAIRIPQEAPLDENLRAAIFDTALPPDHALGHWVDSFQHGIPEYSDDRRLHGLTVASAALLGPLNGMEGGLAPYRVDHHGILGDYPDEKSYHSALQILQRQVQDKDYRMFNISFGPPAAVDDDDVDAFTAVIEELLAGGKRLAFIAVGNEGELDEEMGLNRIQPPSDSVNAISIGAAHSRRAEWDRAAYSCIGPGRLGCRTKPDILFFGGSHDEPFGTIGESATPDRYNVQGTSFSSPAAMRVAGTVMATMGNRLSPVAVKALLIHSSEARDHGQKYVGHGLLPQDIEQILTCRDDEVKVLFQGILSAGKFVSHQIPTPTILEGKLEISATLAFATTVDPSFPSSYVHAGIAATFRPHSKKFGTYKDDDGNVHQSHQPQTSPLFSQKKVYEEADDRKDAHLWDTVLKSRISKLKASINDPVVELHYSRREQGHAVTGSDQPDIPYALVLTLRCKAMPQFYNNVRARYSTSLQVLSPRSEVAIRVK